MGLKPEINIRSEVERATQNQRPLIELSAEQKEQLKTAAGAALAIIAAAGVLTIAVVAPNLFQAIDKIYRISKRKKLSFQQKQKKVEQTFYYLKRQGLIQIRPESKGLVARLTQKGKDKVKALNVNTLQVPKPKAWDGKWWLVAADIPTKDYRWAADLFRNKIKAMQFYPLQRTFWLYPYNPAQEIEFLTQHFGIARFVTVMEINRMDSDDEQKLKKFYGL